jgi:hypothetical protein
VTDLREGERERRRGGRGKEGNVRKKQPNADKGDTKIEESRRREQAQKERVYAHTHHITHAHTQTYTRPEKGRAIQAGVAERSLRDN